MNNTPYQAHGAVAVITLDNPPMNGLSHALRRKIVAGIEQAESDAAIKAIVLIGSAKVFSSGADIREFGTPMTLAEPSLRTVISVLETCGQAGDRRDRRHRAWAAASSSRWAATSASSRRARRWRCRR